MSREMGAPTLDYGTQQEFRLKRCGVVVDYTGKTVYAQRKNEGPRVLATTAALLAAQKRSSEEAGLAPQAF